VAIQNIFESIIKGFKHRGLQVFFEKGLKKGIQANHAKKIAMQLAQLHEAEEVTDMDEPGWLLHSLKGDLVNHWSVQVSGN